MESTYFHWADYLVFALMLGSSAAIGFYYACTGGKQKTTKEYYLADGQMHWFPVACSLLASYISSTTLIGAPAEIYSYGTIFMYQALGVFIGTILGYFLLLPVFEEQGALSIFQYVEMRFNKPLKMVAFIIYLLSVMLYAALVIYGPAISIAAVTGMNLWLAVVSISTVSILYTLLGGLKAVLWTDAVQLCIMILGVLIVIIYGSIAEGGFSKVWEVNRLSGRLDILDAEKSFSFDPRMRHTVWGVLINISFLFTYTYGASQISVQRYLALGTKRDRLIAYMFTAVGLAVLTILSCFIGLLAFSHFRHCDPLSNGEIFSRDQVYPLYVMRLLGHLPGLPGLILSSIFSGSLSTVSSIYSSSAMLILQEFIRPFKPNLSENVATIVSKVLVLVFGALSIILVLFTRYFGAGLMSMGLAISGIFGGPTTALFISGVFLPVVNWKGALIGFLSGSAYGGFIGLGALINRPFVYQYPVSTAGCNITDPAMLSNLTSPLYDPSTWDPQSHYRSGIDSLFDLSYVWNGVGGGAVTVIVAIIFSIILSKEDDPLVEQNQLSPYLEKACCIMPSSWRARIKKSDLTNSAVTLQDKEKETGVDNSALTGSDSGLSNASTTKI